MEMKTHLEEIKKGERFEFGKNWSAFIKGLSEEHILNAEKSLKDLLEIKTLENKTFLDAGSGSGLFSLSARRLGAKVNSFDYDRSSVECALELKNRHFQNDINWVVQEGSVLDKDFLNSLGEFDIVYSWGVLHHTGDMWSAIDNVSSMVKRGGILALALYDDQGKSSVRWRKIKRMYCKSPQPVKLALTLLIGLYFESRYSMGSLLRLQNPLPFKRWRDKKKQRGMSVWHDLVDWIGGYPFEVAKPEEVFLFLRDRGFILSNLKTGEACNEYAFIFSPGCLAAEKMK